MDYIGAEVDSESSGHALPDDLAHGAGSVRVIDQSRLPFAFATIDLEYARGCRATPSGPWWCAARR